MSTAKTFFQFGADNDTITNCLRLLERALAGETRAQRMNRGSRDFHGKKTYKTAKQQQQQNSPNHT